MNKRLIVSGDKVLVSVLEGQDKTDFGLYLPQGVREKEKVQSGLIVKVGPGYPVPDAVALDSEPWKHNAQEIKYLPLQAKEGDFCIFLKDAGIEIEFEKNKYIVVPHSAILVLVRDENNN